MSDSPSTQPNRWRSILAELVAFGPLIVTPVVVLLSIRFHHPWVGMAVFIGMALARRWWWTCVFGLLNALAIVGGFVGCAAAAFKTLTR